MSSVKSASKTVARPPAAPQTAAAKKPAATGKEAAAAGKRSKAGTPVPVIDEKDDYITNLKGQVYLLTIENQMLKKSFDDESAAEEQRKAVAAATPAKAPALPPRTPAADAAAATVMVDYPPEVQDAFEIMRQKYAQLEAKHTAAQNESARATEGLAQQLAAQSSLITTLRKEVSAANDVVTQQKSLLTRVQEQAASDMERASHDIAHLQERVAELQRVIEAKDAHIATQVTEAADLRSRIAVEVAAKDASESARVRTLEAYARMLMTMRILLRRWKVERRAVAAAESALATVSSGSGSGSERATTAAGPSVLTEGFIASLTFCFHSRRFRLLCVQAQAQNAAAAARANAAEAAATQAAASEAAKVAAANAGRDAAAATARAATAQVASLELALSRAESDVEATHDMSLELEQQLSDVQKRLDTAQSAAAKATQALNASQARAGELERALAASQLAVARESEAKDAAEVTAAEAEERAKQLEDALAGAHAHIGTLESQAAELESRYSEQGEELSAEREGRAVAEADVAALTEELKRRPPIDLIRQLDVTNLMQRNMQAAAAMQSLLEWTQKSEGQQ